MKNLKRYLSSAHEIELSHKRIDRILYWMKYHKRNLFSVQNNCVWSSNKHESHFENQN